MTLFVLDTDHLSLYQRGIEPLTAKLVQQPPESLAITVISLEEQMRGRLGQIRKATTAAHFSRSLSLAPRDL